jgi:hypothetical protein
VRALPANQGALPLRRRMALTSVNAADLASGRHRLHERRRARADASDSKRNEPLKRGFDANSELQPRVARTETGSAAHGLASFTPFAWRPGWLPSAPQGRIDPATIRRPSHATTTFGSTLREPATGNSSRPSASTTDLRNRYPVKQPQRPAQQRRESANEGGFRQNNPNDLARRRTDPRITPTSCVRSRTAAINVVATPRTGDQKVTN